MFVCALPVLDALRSLALADELIETIGLHGLDQRIIDIASTRKLASYNAEFVVAAEINETRVVTADAKLIEPAAGRAISIKDFAAGS